MRAQIEEEERRVLRTARPKPRPRTPEPVRPSQERTPERAEAEEQMRAEEGHGAQTTGGWRNRG
jgi:hypothetical protein